MPTKALIRAAGVAATVRGAPRFGVYPTETRLDFAAAMDHVQQTMATVARHDSRERFESLGVEVVTGEARFTSSHRVQGGDRELAGKRYVIASGTRSIAPPIPGLDRVGYCTHVEALQARTLPRSLAVLGAGPIGLEFAQAFARFGVQVTVVEMADRILPREDAEVSDLAKAILGAEGIQILTGTRVVAAEPAGAQKALICQSDNGAARRITADAILVAAGRAPNLEALDLAAAGVDHDRRGDKVDPFLRTTAPHIWAAGDAVGHYLFTHVANYHGRLVVGNALFPFRRRVRYQVVPWVTFLDPEVAHLGLTEAEAADQHGRIRVYRYGFGDLDRAIADGKARGLIKVICSRAGRILGAHCRPSPAFKQYYDAAAPDLAVDFGTVSVLPVAVLARHRVPEVAPEYVTALEAGWVEHVARGG